MGDRTTVTLRVLTSQAEQAEELFEYVPAESETEDSQLAEYIFEEVNYGELSFLPQLRDAGIAYDSDWDAGSNYGPGSDYCRFTEDGKLIEKQVFESAVNPDLNTLMRLLDTPDQLKQYIVNHHESVTVPGWENQEEYGKRYLARRLIAPE